MGGNTSDMSHNVEPDGITTVINRAHRESPVDWGGGHIYSYVTVSVKATMPVSQRALQ